MRKLRVSRKWRSTMYANIILFNNLYDEWKVYSYSHPKIKSKFRLATLFLLNKKLFYDCPPFIHNDLNMDNLEDNWNDLVNIAKVDWIGKEL